MPNHGYHERREKDTETATVTATLAEKAEKAGQALRKKILAQMNHKKKKRKKTGAVTTTGIGKTETLRKHMMLNSMLNMALARTTLTRRMT